ncbi:hypothetical protein Pmani_027733 [Petrolisthes manimaculis]|uniref:Major facilitator superfamily (MFS) profile domain-containing protein n=1 Tax=Petrolisthes manimaculis TaxID=1843537 RepID=A0AAE1P2D2_9EUCA|nr:hypothetical protein Pmani_027733 [Petrolisthes manimaculis]
MGRPIGILYDIKKCFDINDSKAGLLQTAFILVYMVMAPIFGYLGDRFSRKLFLTIGICCWSLATLIGSFMPTYELFLLFRCLVGVGEASYSTIAPTIISDLFVKDQRSNMLALFYFAIPVGSGLGYIVGAEVTELVRTGADDYEAWRWGLRVTPAMGLVAVILILTIIRNPPRGQSEGGQHLHATSFKSDLIYLFTNKSYVLCTLAFTCVTFVAGALAFWGPLFTQMGVKVQPNPNVNVDNVAFVFGAIAMTAGLIGVPLGSILGQKLRIKIPYADPMVCGVGLLFSVPLFLGAIILAGLDTIASYVVVFFGQIFLNLNWAVVTDIVLYITIPTRRSSAEAFQILFAHALGDAGSPYLIGVVADSFKPYIVPPNMTTTTTAVPFITTTPVSLNTSVLAIHNLTTLALDDDTVLPVIPDTNDDYVEFKSKQYAMFLCCIVNVLGAVFFFWNACYIAKDKEQCDRVIAGSIEREQREAGRTSRTNSSSSSSGVSVSSHMSEEESEEAQQAQNLLI